MLIPSSAPFSAHHPVTPTPRPPPFPLPLVHFPELEVSHVLSPFLIFPTHFFFLPFYSLSLLFIFPKWMGPYNVCPSLIDLLHSANTLQFYPRWSKWEVFVISKGWGIFHCIYRPHLLYPFIFRWTTTSCKVHLIKAKETKAKMNYWDLIKIKASAQQKKQSTKLKDNLQNGRRYLQMTYQLISNIYKELIKLYSKEKNNPIMI